MRATLVLKLRHLFVEGREEVEIACRKLVREEVAAWRGGRRCHFMLSVECLGSPLIHGGDKRGNVEGIQDNNYKGIRHRHKIHLHLTKIRVKKTCHG